MFVGYLQIEFIPGKFACFSLRDLHVVVNRDLTIVIPAGTYSDFGSIPGYVVLPCLVPRIGLLREAYFLHDYLYRKGFLSRCYSDYLLLKAAFVLAKLAAREKGFWSKWRAMVIRTQGVLAYSGVVLWGWIPWLNYRRAERKLHDTRG